MWVLGVQSGTKRSKRRCLVRLTRDSSRRRGPQFDTTGQQVLLTKDETEFISWPESQSFGKKKLDSGPSLAAATQCKELLMLDFDVTLQPKQTGTACQYGRKPAAACKPRGKGTVGSQLSQHVFKGVITVSRGGVGLQQRCSPRGLHPCRRGWCTQRGWRR